MLVVCSGCGNDPNSATGVDASGATLPGNAPGSGSKVAGATSAGTTLPGNAPAGAAGGSSAAPGQAPAAPGQPAMGAGGMGNAGSPPQGAPSPAASPAGPVSWLSYTSQQFRFSISYPDTYLVVDQGNLPQDVPNVVGRVQFQDKALASSPTANLQPPQFLIDVFENKQSLVLEDWIAANERRAAPQAATIGNASGYLVQLQTMQAPNQFYFVSQGQYVYRLIPLGQHSQQMLQSFKIG
jgi:hypothetical protein